LPEVEHQVDKLVYPLQQVLERLVQTAWMALGCRTLAKEGVAEQVELVNTAPGELLVMLLRQEDEGRIILETHLFTVLELRPGLTLIVDHRASCLEVPAEPKPLR
jgi:hypothetical protein